jgi:hypothetical protein
MVHCRDYSKAQWTDHPLSYRDMVNLEIEHDLEALRDRPGFKANLGKANHPSLPKS